MTITAAAAGTTQSWVNDGNGYLLYKEITSIGYLYKIVDNLNTMRPSSMHI